MLQAAVIAVVQLMTEWNSYQMGGFLKRALEHTGMLASLLDLAAHLQVCHLYRTKHLDVQAMQCPHVPAGCG